MNAGQIIKKVAGAPGALIAGTILNGRYRRMEAQGNTDADALRADRKSGGNSVGSNPASKAFQVRTQANDARYRRDPKFKAAMDAKLGMR